MNEAMKAAFESKNQIRGIHKNLDGSYIDAIQQAKWEGYQAALSQQPARSTMLRKPTIITPDERDMLKNATCFANDGAERDWSELEPAQPSCEPVAWYVGALNAFTTNEDEMRKMSINFPVKPLYAAPPDLADLRARNKHLSDQVAGFYGAIHAFRSENEDLEQRVITACKDVNHFKAENAQLKESTNRLDDMLSNVIAERNNLEQSMCEFRAENERMKEREQWIHDNSKTVGGGHGFTVTFFVPVDHEDIFCGISEAIKLEQK